MAESYIQVILPLKLNWTPFYRTESGSVSVGDRVRVLFANRSYVGVVCAVDVTPDVPSEKITAIEGVESGLEPVTPQELELWNFVSSYYLCTVGEVYRSAYPHTKTASEQVAARSRQRAELVERKRQALFQKRIDALKERISKKEEILSARGSMQSKRAQSEAVTARLEAECARLREELAALILEAEPETEAEPERKLQFNVPALSEQENAALEGLEKASGHSPALLSGAGDSRIAILANLAEKQLSAGRSVLCLVPEIALSEKTSEELRAIFPDSVTLFHSEETVAARRKVSELARSGRPSFIIGTRSALFLPFRSLGLVIIDEEQDPSYKQDEPSPRYNGRDTAVMLAGIHGASVVLSSDNPSLETVLNCRTGKYALVECRGAASGLCPMEVIDTSAERRKRGMRGELSIKLIHAVDDALSRGWNPVVLNPYNDLEPLKQAFVERWPDAGIWVMTLRQARRTAFPEDAAVVLMNGDALVKGQDFRTDERALQTLNELRRRGRMLVVQARSADHPVFSEEGIGVDMMLQERKDFDMPPFKRLVDIRDPRSKGEILRRIVLDRDRSLAEKKAGIFSEFGQKYIIDVDPS